MGVLLSGSQNYLFPASALSVSGSLGMISAVPTGTAPLSFRFENRCKGSNNILKRQIYRLKVGLKVLIILHGLPVAAPREPIFLE